MIRITRAVSPMRLSLNRPSARSRLGVRQIPTRARTASAQIATRLMPCKRSPARRNHRPQKVQRTARNIAVGVVTSKEIMTSRANRPKIFVGRVITGCAAATSIVLVLWKILHQIKQGFHPRVRLPRDQH